MDRRRFLSGAVGCCVCSSIHASLVSAQDRELPPFCSLDASFDVNQYQRMSQSGNAQLDRALIAELRKLMTIFPISPGFQYIDDQTSPNAFALDRTLIANTTGTILFGVSLLNSELSSDFGGAAVAGIAAHEGAHILQFYSGFGGRLAGDTAREMELHADFLAGYYFAATNRTERSLLVFGDSLFSKGDFDFNNVNHHGTPDERLRAMRAGYEQAQLGRNLDQAIDEGIRHVHS